MKHTTSQKPVKAKPALDNQPLLALPDTGFVKLPNILHFIPVSRTTWLNGVKAGKFPKPVALTERTVAWKVEDIKALIEKIGGAA